jgi:hypothetical protein
VNKKPSFSFNWRKRQVIKMEQSTLQKNIPIPTEAGKEALANSGFFLPTQGTQACQFIHLLPLGVG